MRTYVPGRCVSCFFVLLVLRRAFDLVLKSSQCPIPKLVEPSAQRAEPSRVDVIEAARSLGPVRHKTRLLQYPQMLRYRGATDRHAARDRADRLRAGPEPLEDPPAGGIGKRRQCLIVSHRLP